MKRIFWPILTVSLILIYSSASAQSLLEMLEEENKQNQEAVIAEATFKATRIINGQTVESVGKNQANFIVSHRFGNLSMGAYDFWGLDHSVIRLGLEYGLTDRLDIGIGRSNEQKLIDGYIKYKILRQSSGVKGMPITLSWYSATYYTHQKWQSPNRDNLVSSRFYYVHQAIIARKFSDNFSLQVAPGVVHRNLVVSEIDQNDVPFVGIAGRFKLTNRFSLNTEYFWILPGQTADVFINPLAIGFDIETGGHIFQLHFSNSRGRTEKSIPENKNNWLSGDIGFGFNIIRHFSLKKKKT